ncbi:regulator of volume decrease after cellular swelling-domain-containing protein [Podospora didyma]|uniref:Regulator of volume decrease after cellular swelling-domain-containing protein n=1 Tax=Podospora didyma TaxID=330526 RepID=A0AAE0K6R5_9PEZI|nr:regulator of volume decrease after cellular swelling-domain-containing protein [Podospora didyma]
MLPETIRSPPSLSEFKTLAEHLEQTPETFYGGKPVLYYHATGAKAWVPKSQRGNLPFFPADLSSAPTEPESLALEKLTLDESPDENVEQKVDLYVSSKTLTIFCPATESGLSIPYPLVSIHAVKTYSQGEHKVPTVYLQLELSDGGANDDDFDTVELTLIPSPSSSSADSTPIAADTTTTGGDSTLPREISALFNAISECSNLNPDPEASDEEEEEDDRIIFEADHQAIEGFSGVFAGARDGGLPAAMPGSSGWITAENVGEFFDADGNWIGGEEGVSRELGDGAGVVHGRDDDMNGHGTDEEGDLKRTRTD